VSIYAVPFGRGSNATSPVTEIEMPFDVDIDNFWINVETAFPTGVDDTLDISLLRNGVSLFGGHTRIPPGWTGKFQKRMIQFTDLWTAGDRFAVWIKMNSLASGPSGALGAWGVEGRQRG
jgi:hypothetical protein